MIETNRIYQGDVLEVLQDWPDEFVQCVVTSPPYWGLRDYGVPGQLGLEKTPEEYTEKLVEIFREVRRVLRKDGTLWLNMGDCFAMASMRGKNSKFKSIDQSKQGIVGIDKNIPDNLKPKDLVGIPWRLAFALQADGWWLRSDIIWSKPNPMLESVRDRPTKAHEYLFLLTKSARYYYDQDAVREGSCDPPGTHRGGALIRAAAGGGKDETGKVSWEHHGGGIESLLSTGYRNLHTVWTIPTQPYPEAHFATFPEALVEKPIMAGTSEKGCCPKCGAGWKRILEKIPSTMNIRIRDGKKGILDKKSGHSGRATATIQEIGSYENEVMGESKTLDWQPTCSCGINKTEPCIVLDPFIGSGTVAKVALRAGRRFLGIELNPEYIALAEKRIEPLMRQSDLFFDHSTKEASDEV